MEANDFLELLLKEEFQREIHHLLWIDPHTNKGMRDDGWNCRDHALIVAGIARMFGHESIAVTGEAMFVQGPIGERRPVGRAVNPHSWVYVENVGAFDISARLKGFRDLPEWIDWKTLGLAGSKFRPVDQIVYLSMSDPVKYQNSCNAATHVSDQKFAFYLRKKEKRVNTVHFQSAFKWCNSPLTVRLSNLFKKRDDLYPKAILHLTALLKGEASSVAHLPQMIAWKEIAGKKSDAIEQVCVGGARST